MREGVSSKRELSFCFRCTEKHIKRSVDTHAAFIICTDKMAHVDSTDPLLSQKELGSVPLQHGGDKTLNNTGTS